MSLIPSFGWAQWLCGRVAADKCPNLETWPNISLLLYYFCFTMILSVLTSSTKCSLLFNIKSTHKMFECICKLLNQKLLFLQKLGMCQVLQLGPIEWGWAGMSHAHEDVQTHIFTLYHNCGFTSLQENVITRQSLVGGYK